MRIELSAPLGHAGMRRFFEIFNEFKLFPEINVRCPFGDDFIEHLDDERIDGGFLQFAACTTFDDCIHIFQIVPPFNEIRCYHYQIRDPKIDKIARQRAETFKKLFEDFKSIIDSPIEKIIDKLREFPGDISIELTEEEISQFPSCMIYRNSNGNIYIDGLGRFSKLPDGSYNLFIFGKPPKAPAIERIRDKFIRD